jgi:hypothetical protein
MRYIAHLIYSLPVWKVKCYTAFERDGALPVRGKARRPLIFAKEIAGELSCLNVRTQAYLKGSSYAYSPIAGAP